MTKDFITIIIVATASVLWLTGCGNGVRRSEVSHEVVDVPAVMYAEQITINELPIVLERLKNGQTEYDFVGICSSPVACIYFMQENGKFYIDYEAITKSQLPYLTKIKLFASEHGYPTVENTYGNTPIDYHDMTHAPVLSLRIDTDTDSIAKVGIQLMQTIFQDNDSTLYDIVP